MALTYRPSDYLMEDNILHDTSHWLPGAAAYENSALAQAYEY